MFNVFKLKNHKLGAFFLKRQSFIILKWNVIIHTCAAAAASLGGVHSFVTRREPLAHAVNAKLIV